MLYILEALRDFVYNSTENILFTRPDTNETVRPQVYIGWTPPKNLNPDDYDIPGIIIGIPEGSEEDDSSILNVTFTFATYSPGADTTKLDMQGYKELLYLQNFVRYKLLSKRIINSKTTVQKPLTWGVPEEQPYPYWVGWMKFQATIPTVNFEDIENEVLDFLSAEIEIPANKLERSE
jgi:hypothetical protein